jgi:hypothetical protein
MPIFAAIIGAMLFGLLPVRAHDSWIGGREQRNPITKEWCCGEGDCFIVPSDQVSTYGLGYVLWHSERVPFAETQPSPDGAFWRCKRPDGTRRCFFAPVPTY